MYSQENHKSGKLKNTIINTILALIFIFFLATVYMAVSKISDPEDSTFFGFKPITIESGAMEPTIKTGALVIGKKTDFKDIIVGDIVTFEMADGDFNTRRIIAKADGLEILYGKGDAAANADLLDITPKNYKYKIVVICNWTTELDTPKGILLYIVLPLICLISIFVISVIIVKVIRKSHWNKMKKELQSNAPPGRKYRVSPTFSDHEGETGWRGQLIKENRIESGTLPVPSQHIPPKAPASGTTGGRLQVNVRAGRANTGESVGSGAAVPVSEWREEPVSEPAAAKEIMPFPHFAWGEKAVISREEPVLMDWRDELLRDIDFSNIDLDAETLRDIRLEDFDL